MGWMDTGIAKTRAAASDARADLAEVNSRLSTAEAWCKITSIADAAVQQLAATWPARQDVLVPVFAAATSQTSALHSRAVASLDDLHARREAAKSRLSFAEKSQHAMTKIADESDRLLRD